MITIEEIKAQCREVIALSASLEDVSRTISGEEANGSFRHNRTFSPKAARVILSVILTYENDVKHCDISVRGIPKRRLDQICEQWEVNQ